MSLMSRNKGKRGERQVIDWLQPIVDSITTELKIDRRILQRNTVQSDRGGSDVIGVDWMAAEVKNCETQTPGLLSDWWIQCKEQATTWSIGKKLTPVLFYKRNHSSWRVRMAGALWCPLSRVYVNADPVDVSPEDFEKYFRARCVAEWALNKACPHFNANT